VSSPAPTVWVNAKTRRSEQARACSDPGRLSLTGLVGSIDGASAGAAFAGGQIAAAITMTGLEIALQTSGPNLYDTSGDRSAWCLTLPSVMDESHPTDPPRKDGPLAPTLTPPSVDSTFELVERAKGGDSDALDRLFARFLPSLRRWASGRLPRWTRGMMDTDDLVQETVSRAVKHIDTFESRHEGALQAYLRQAVMNRIRDEVRRTKRAPPPTTLPDDHADRAASPLDLAIGDEAVARYEAALARLRPEDREAVVARIEMDGTYRDVALALGKPSADAARMAVSRALLRLAEEMSRGEG
jgi:RNA polymerase sigma-70 factor, ECF subfamily